MDTIAEDKNERNEEETPTPLRKKKNLHISHSADNIHLMYPK